MIFFLAESSIARRGMKNNSRKRLLHFPNIEHDTLEIERKRGSAKKKCIVQPSIFTISGSLELICNANLRIISELMNKVSEKIVTLQSQFIFK